MEPESVAVHNSPRDSHLWHHSEPVRATVNVQVEKNSRGTNWSATVVGAASVAEAMAMLDEARTELEHRYGSQGG